MKQEKSYLLGHRGTSKVLYERKMRECYQAFCAEKDHLYAQLVNTKNDFQNQLEEKKKEQLAIARELMKVKWNAISRHAEETEAGADLLECLICGTISRRDSMETKVAECIFNGGKLERYVCPCCGAIFGPTKFSNLSQQEKDEDYYVHYLGFSEGDSTEKELRAFYMLNPSKEGIYLNFGCGNWSRSLQILHDEGYTVYGYEPYARNENSNPYIITEKSVLEKMRFDGIYSNDVIEHLINPIEGFEYMKTLLRSSVSMMSHSTSCYIYKHEETRFHTYFFTGKSLKYLCDKTGLEIFDSINDEKEKDFICYVFKPKCFAFNYLPLMHTLGSYECLGHGIKLQKDATLFGPYLNYPKGQLKLRVNLQLSEESKQKALITANSGLCLLKEVELTDGDNIVDVFLEKEEKDVEFVIRVGMESVLIKEIVQI